MYILFLTPTTSFFLPKSYSKTLQQFINIRIFEAFNFKVQPCYQFILLLLHMLMGGCFVHIKLRI